MEVSEMITELELKGYRVKKITPGMKMDSDECVRLDEKGESKDCLDCYCSICIMQ